MPDTRETIVRIDHDLDYSEVWTENQALVKRLLRLGFRQTDQQGKGVWLRGQIRQISFKSTVKRRGIPPTEAAKAALAKFNAERSRP